MFKWPYQSRGATQKAQESASAAAEPILDFSQYSSNGAYIKVWLPERIETALDQLSVDQRSSRPDILRAILFQHVYGALACEQFLEWKRKQDEQRFYQPAVPDLEAPLFSRGRASMDALGKSTSNLKFWLPAMLKDDLAGIAAANGLGISDYVRLTLARVLLGEKSVATWLRAIQDLPDGVKADEAQS